MMHPRSRWFVGAAGLLLAGAGAATVWLPVVGAGGLLHPWRRPVSVPTPQSCEDVTFVSEEIELKGWRCRPDGRRRGVVVYMHGVADNRTSSVGVIDRFVERDYEVVAYDSRAHGESGGTACTYGFREKGDLRRVLDQLEPGPVALIGTSLGAAVALQTAAEDSRVATVVAAETFSDLRTIVADRAPFFFTQGAIARAFQRAEREGRFVVSEVSPLAAAARVRVPVLLVHGGRDVDTPAYHSRRVFAALPGPKRLVIVPEAAHNTSLHGDVWQEIEDWIDDGIDARSVHPGGS